MQEESLILSLVVYHRPQLGVQLIVNYLITSNHLWHLISQTDDSFYLILKSTPSGFVQRIENMREILTVEYFIQR